MAKVNKVKVLVTAGSVWVKIDSVRILSNVATGKTGISIAGELSRQGFQVTLLLGPQARPLVAGRIRVIRFTTFDQLQQILKKELGNKSYRVVIHSAAVPDYRLLKPVEGKISSSRKSLVIRLKPTPKLISRIRNLRKDIFLVQFKLEVGLAKRNLIAAGYKSLCRNKSDLVVANDLNRIKDNKHPAFIIDKSGKSVSVKTKKELALKLTKMIKEAIR